MKLIYPNAESLFLKKYELGKNIHKLNRACVKTKNKTLAEVLNSIKITDLYNRRCNNNPRSEEELLQLIICKFKNDGFYPSTTDREISRYHRWLKRNCSSYEKFFLENFGFNFKKFNYEIKLDNIKKEIREYYKSHGKYPNARSSKKWNTYECWLRYHGTSLSDLKKKLVET